ASSQLTASGLFTGVTGPLNPAGVTLTPAQFKSLHATLGDPRAPAGPALGAGPLAGGPVRGLPGHRAVRPHRLGAVHGDPAWRWNWWPSRLSRVGGQPGGPDGPGGPGSTGGPGGQGGEGTEKDTESAAPRAR
ncbi:MAG TPA: hypothetical protein VGD83_15015, partial [Streptosporangiaceae bacterium]